MADNPTDVTYVNGVPVDKGKVRLRDKTNAVLVLADANELRDTNLALQQVVKLKSTGRDYVLDTGSTGPDDGVRTIRSLDGYYFAIVDIDGLDGVDGASALTVVRVVATTNVAIATALENGDTVDGVALATNDLVLLAGQTAPEENGVYVVVASGAASRAAAFANYDDHPGRYFSVMEGSAGADKLYRCTSNNGGTLGTTALVFTEFAAGGNPATDDGASLGTTSLKWSDLFLASGAVINFNNGDVTITHSSNEIAVAGGLLRLGSVAKDVFAQSFQTDSLILNNAGGASSFLMRASAGGTDSKLMDFALSAGIFEQRFLNDAFSLAGPIFQATRSGYQVAQTSYFANAIEQFRLTPSHAYFPAIGTTASAANAFLNSGSSPVNELLRSTSSLAYKRDVEPLQEEYANKVLDLQPIWYRSKASNDNPDWSWYGLGAEDVAKVDPRLVQWGYQDDDFDLVPRERVETIERKVETVVDGKTVVETVPHEIKTVTHERVLKEGAQLKPDGVMYERIAVLLLDVVKRQEARIAALEAAR